MTGRRGSNITGDTITLPSPTPPPPPAAAGTLHFPVNSNQWDGRAAAGRGPQLVNGELGWLAFPKSLVYPPKNSVSIRDARLRITCRNLLLQLHLTQQIFSLHTRGCVSGLCSAAYTSATVHDYSAAGAVTTQRSAHGAAVVKGSLHQPPSGRSPGRWGRGGVSGGAPSASAATMESAQTPPPEKHPR